MQGILNRSDRRAHIGVTHHVSRLRARLYIPASPARMFARCANSVHLAHARTALHRVMKAHVGLQM